MVFVCRCVVVSTSVGRGGKVGMLLRWWGLGGEVRKGVWDVLGGGLVRSSWVIIWLCLVVGSGKGLLVLLAIESMSGKGVA
jgi:hypothetical protein